MLTSLGTGFFGFGFASMAALIFGAVTVVLLDLSSNVAMQPFKMMVGDMVNDEYLGLFNGSICLPQIVALLCSFVLFPLMGGVQHNMVLVAGVSLSMAACAVLTIKETRGGVED